MTNYPNDGLCHETSGFLFSHRCDHIAVKECVRCGKAICQDHGHSIADGLACTTCLKLEAQTQPQDMPGAAPGAKPGVPPVVNSPAGYRSRPYYDDPYFYGSYWYPGYGYGYGYGHGYYGGRHSSRSSSTSDPTSNAASHDPNDFTEGDAENLRNEGDEAFESEMGES